MARSQIATTSPSLNHFCLIIRPCVFSDALDKSTFYLLYLTLHRHATHTGICSLLAADNNGLPIFVLLSVHPRYKLENHRNAKELTITRRKSERRPDVLRGPVSRQWWTVDDRERCVARHSRTEAVTATSHRNKYRRKTISCTQRHNNNQKALIEFKPTPLCSTLTPTFDLSIPKPYHF